jgi:hypothetical protein
MRERLSELALRAAITALPAGWATDTRLAARVSCPSSATATR